VATGLFGIDLTIVRGFSNVAGDRDRAGWRMGEALAAAADIVRELAG
jgi:hypothetical protein